MGLPGRATHLVQADRIACGLVSSAAIRTSDLKAVNCGACLKLAARHPNDHGLKPGDQIALDSDTWLISAVGAATNGRVYLHVRHPTRGSRGKAGFIPAQECGWYDGSSLQASPFDSNPV